jgi:hypothetical protein
MPFYIVLFDFSCAPCSVAPQVFDDLVHSPASPMKPPADRGAANSKDHGRFRNAVSLNVAKQKHLAAASLELQRMHQHCLHHSRRNVWKLGQWVLMNSLYLE